MAYKIADDVLKNRIIYLDYLDFLSNEPYRYYEYRLDKSVNAIKNIASVYSLSIKFANNLSLFFKLSNGKFIKIDLSLPECGSSDIYVTIKDIELHIIKSINNYDFSNNTNIMDQLNQLDLFDARCIIDIKEHRIEIFKSTHEYIDYHKPLKHIHLDAYCCW